MVTHTYELSDTYTVVLTATNDCGQGSMTHDVVVLRPVEKHYIYLPLVLRQP